MGMNRFPSKPDFGKSFFEKHQKALVRFLNTGLGRWFFALGKVEVPKNERIFEVGPNRVSYGWKLKQEITGGATRTFGKLSCANCKGTGKDPGVPHESLGLTPSTRYACGFCLADQNQNAVKASREGAWKVQKTTMFFTSNRLQNRLEYIYRMAARFIPQAAAWKLMQPLAGTSGAFAFLPMVALTTSTFFPDANPETTSVDGDVTNLNIGATWSTLRNAADGTASNDSGTGNDCALISTNATLDLFNRIDRGFFLFDTSSIPDSDTVDSGTFSLKTPSLTDNATLNQALSLVESTPASNTAITTADYDQVGTTQQASDIDLGSLSTTNYNDFALNATGIGSVAKTGITKFGTRMSSDRTGTAPTWAASVSSRVAYSSAEEAGTSSDPKLVVIHSGAAGAVALNLLLMGAG